MTDFVFSEIFSCYYKAITEIVNRAPLTEREIKEIIKENCFDETAFHLLPKIENLPFIEKKDGRYYSLLKHKIRLPLTTIEKEWAKAITEDERFPLFAENFDNRILDSVSPLYEQSMFRHYDKFTDGDPFTDKIYQNHFRQINAAMETKSVIKITYRGPKQNKISTGHFLPLRFEYSPQDDKFRCFTAAISKGGRPTSVYLNLQRIIDVGPSWRTVTKMPDTETSLTKMDCDEPIQVEVYDKRNSIERFMVEFSTYKKRSEFDGKTSICTSKIYYRKIDETEILIKLLSFGPALKVLGPKDFKKQFVARIEKQYRMLQDS